MSPSSKTSQLYLSLLVFSRGGKYTGHEVRYSGKGSATAGLIEMDMIRTRRTKLSGELMRMRMELLWMPQGMEFH